MNSQYLENQKVSRGDLPFVPPHIVDAYLENIPGYSELKSRTKLKTQPQETKLKNDILFNDVYDKTSRPVRNDTTVVDVRAGISLYHVLDIDEKQQLLSIVIAVRLSWFDEYLQWNETEYSNIASILLPSSLIWLPDVVILNTAEILHTQDETNVIVSNDGFVLWMFPKLVKTYCYLDLSWFPVSCLFYTFCRILNFNIFLKQFDEQNCDLILSPLTYNIRQVSFLTSASNNASYYDEQGQEWTVLSITPKCVEVRDPLSSYKVARIIFRVSLKRKSLFYLYTCVFPCMLIYFVTLLSFFVPGNNFVN